MNKQDMLSGTLDQVHSNSLDHQATLDQVHENSEDHQDSLHELHDKYDKPVAHHVQELPGHEHGGEYAHL